MVNKKNLKKLLQKQFVQKAGVFAVALLVIGMVSYFGVQQQRDSRAATGGTLYMNPATATAAAGSIVTVSIRETSGTNPVNAAQVAVTFNSARLKYVGLEEGAAFPTIAATDSSTPGLVRVARGTAAGTTVTGDKVVIKLNFEVLAQTGTSTIGFDQSQSFIALAADGTDMLSTVTGSVITHTANASMSLTPATGSYATNAIIPVVINEDSGIANVNVAQASLTYDATKLEFSSVTNGSVFTTIAATDTATPGIIRIARGVPGSGVSGSQTVATVNFKVIGTSGSPVVDFNDAESYLTRTSDGLNILGTTNSATYTITGSTAPTIATVTPASGPAAGGTAITITGTNFATGATVTVGGTAATNVTRVSGTTITATTPAGTAGARNVVVTNPDSQSVTKTGAFTYVAKPVITTVSPVSGPTTGGTRITLTGTGFVNGATVNVGGAAATAVTFTSSTSVSATTPAGTAGARNVVIINPDAQQDTKTAAFTYTAVSLPAPVVSSIAPNVGFPAGGLTVTILGSNFVNGATVTIGGTAATNVIFVNSTTMTARTPARSAGVANVVVTNPDSQSSSLANGFTVRLAGDANGDGRINAIDLSILITKDGQAYAPADFNGDGTIGAADMAILLAAWTW